MTFIKACAKAIDDAKKSGRDCYVYADSNRDYHVTGKRSMIWLFQAYPGGRKVMSMKGAELARSLGFNV